MGYGIRLDVAGAEPYRRRVTQARGELADAMRALSVPLPDVPGAIGHLEACASTCAEIVEKLCGAGRG